MSTLSKWERLQNAAHRLNYDAYMQQSKGKGGVLPRFHPCAKANALIEYSGYRQDIFVMSMVWPKVVGTYCDCHYGLTIKELIDMEFDDTYRMAHYKGISPEKYKEQQEKQHEQ